MTLGEFPKYIPLEQLNDAPWNARKTFDRAAVEELASSIKAHGVLVPLIVRPVDLEDPDAVAFEIVAGHRRFHAAQLTQLGELPCIIRDLDEDDAREIGLIDNLQRENVPAMEEAVAFSELLTRVGSVEAVAARVQKDQAYVAKRLKLCTLSLAGQDALKHGLITVDHALVLARLGAAEQDAALKWCIDHSAGVKVSVNAVIEERVKRQQENAKQRESADSYRWRHTWEPQSVQRLKDHIASDSGTVLARAPWDLDSAVLIPDATACNACPQNTIANAPLFGDLRIGEAKCTDTGCFREKTQAFVQIKTQEVAKLEHGGPHAQILRVSWKYTTTAPRMEKDGTGLNLSQVFKAGQWIEAKKKSCDNVLAAVTVDWSDAGERGHMGRGEKLRKPGEVVQVCIDPKCKAHPKEWAKPKAASTGGIRNENSAEARAQREKREAEAKAENAVRAKLLGTALEGIQSLPAEALRRLLLQLLDDWQMENDANDRFPGLKKAIEKSAPDSAQFARAACGLLFCGDDSYELWADDDRPVDRGRKEFIAMLKLLGYDASKAWEKPKAPKKGGKM